MIFPASLIFIFHIMKYSFIIFLLSCYDYGGVENLERGNIYFLFHILLKENKPSTVQHAVSRIHIANCRAPMKLNTDI